MQDLLPKLALTRAVGWLAARHGGFGTRAAIRWFIGRYGVDMAQAADPRVGAYASFNDFFTRALKPGARPVAQAAAPPRITVSSRKIHRPLGPQS